MEVEEMRMKRVFLIRVVSFLSMVILSFVPEIATAEYHIPATIDTVLGLDGSVWEQVNLPGFGNENNLSVITMAEYQGRLYAMTRNDEEGVEIWRTAGTSWEQVLFPNGETNGVYGNSGINNLFADMIVFQDKLYYGFSSGFQGNALKSSGCEIWRYDGTTWEPVISDKKDTDEAGTITGLSGCEDDDGDVTALITDSSKSWTTDQWAGGTLQITSGEGNYRRFDIISNTADTLTIQQNEMSGQTGTEYTICGKAHYINPFPPYEYDLGALQVGDSYEIGIGYDENGFGNYWNRAVNCMIIFDNKLYVSTGLNYEYGAQVWYTEDDETWTLTQPPNSFDLFHSDPTYPSSKKPVTVTVLSLCPSSVSGTEIIYAGGTGSSGNAGACARMAKLTDTGWELIVDASVDENDTGTNENGFGDGMSCTMFNGNFMPWSLADFNDKLYVGINSAAGARVLYTPNGSSEDGNWFSSAGGDSGIPNGFDGLINEGITQTTGTTFYKNIVANIFTYEDHLYAGLIASYVPSMGGTEEYLTGAHLWKTADGLTWKQVTGNGFGDSKTISFEAFTPFNGTLYVSGSKGANSMPGGLGGAKIFRLVPGADVAITKAQVTYNLQKENKDGIMIKGEFTPATTIDPAAEIIAVSISSATGGSLFSDTIDAGCFTKKGKGNVWSYERKKSECETKIDSMRIDGDKSTFSIKADGENLSLLPELMNNTVDVTVDIRVGNDRGVATNPFRVKKDKKTGVPVKLQFP
jgi:hypothetical protein